MKDQPETLDVRKKVVLVRGNWTYDMAKAARPAVVELQRAGAVCVLLVPPSLAFETLTLDDLERVGALKAIRQVMIRDARDMTSRRMLAWHQHNAALREHLRRKNR